MSDRELGSVVVTEGTPRADGTRDDKRDDKRDNGKGTPEEHGGIRNVRATDIEPYTGLRYLSKLFKLMAIVLLLLLVAEIITGLSTQGSMAIPTLLGEASRLIVLAGILWGSGDVAHLLIDVGHDVRAGRILLARQLYQLTGGKGAGASRVSGPTVSGSGTGVTMTGAPADVIQPLPPEMP